MNPYFLPVSLMHLCFWVTFIACIDDPAYLTGEVSINCGSNEVFAARGGKEWFGDTHSKFSSSLQIKGFSSISGAVDKFVSDDKIPYFAARISRSSFSYLFRLSPGQKFIRFHLNPTLYKGFKKFSDLFNVEAGPLTLLGNFSASLASNALGLSSFTKEFCINIGENKELNIVFSPVNSQLDTNYAFINGIEIIPVALGHSYFHIEAQLLGHESRVLYINNGTALEMVQRVIVRRDFSDMFGMNAKEKANDMTWNIPVDVGFRYLIRFYFSNQELKMAESGQVIFKVLINKVLTSTKINVVEESVNDGISRFSYRNYVLTMEGRKEEGKRGLLVSLLDEFMNGYGVFTGFEIFKLSNPDNSLASPNPLPPAEDSASWTIQALLSTIGHTNATAAVAITVIALVNIVVHELGEIWELNDVEEENKVSAKAERSCRRFSLKEIQLGTGNFSDSHLIGRGGFGKVYRCLIDDMSETVAIKRLKSNSRQGAREFLAEIETLSELRHVNLVSLIGYCKENQEMIIVYEYMANGTLADHLYKLARTGNNCSSLTWNQCLNICIGAGRGLDYLHTGHSIIHRDVKVSNILLDKNFTAKVSDFGLVKQESRSPLQSHVSTKVKGTFGYFDPNYFISGKLTRKSDTYSFGVVLFEVLCGRPAVDQSVAMDEKILTKWARDKISKGEVEMIVASSLREEISSHCLKTFVNVVERCLDDDPKKRPTMAQVVLKLEYALEQQETTIPSVLNETDNDPCNDEFNSFDGKQLTMTPKDVQTRSPISRVIINHNMDNGYLPSEENSKRATTYKPSWWPWSTLWNKFKSSKKNGESMQGVNLPKFDLDIIKFATKKFSPSNVLVRGVFCSVYKAILPTGQIAAVKRFSVNYRNGFENEVLLLQNFRHQNIIKLLGYCVAGNEKFLVYEFMENGCLETHIFVDEQHRKLQWTLRMKIIMGISRGLQYLHQDSGLRIIHRVTDPSHILLDSEMNPKISNFTLSRSMEGDQSYVSTVISERRGYVSPELHSGMVSCMSDVYIFGVVVLQIVSGKRYCYHYEGMDIITFAWKLWNDGRVLEFVDESIRETDVEGALRCIQVGLLCTQEQPDDRPTMSVAIDMLDGKQLIWLPIKNVSMFNFFENYSSTTSDFKCND